MIKTADRSEATIRGGLARLVTARVLINVANGIALLASASLTSLLTRVPLQLALPPTLSRLSSLLFTLPAGAVIDRTNRLRLILSIDVARAFGIIVTAVAVCLAGPLPAPETAGVSAPGLFVLLFACALVIETAEAFRDTAAQTIIPAIVDRADFERANARMVPAELGGNALIGQALGAVLIAAAVWLPLAANAVLFRAACALPRGLRVRFTPASSLGRDWRAKLGEGVAFLKDSPCLRSWRWVGPSGAFSTRRS